jgi:hypothetical protein
LIFGRALLKSFVYPAFSWRRLLIARGWVSLAIKSRSRATPNMRL